MDNATLQERLDDISRKLDAVTEYIAAEQRRRREAQELKDDLTLIGRDVYQTAVRELEEVSAHFDTADLLHLLKKLLRNTRHLNRMLDQVDGFADFLDAARPLGREIFRELMETLDELDRKGYFAFAREAIGVADAVVTSFSPADVRQLRESVVAILNTVRSITQPEMLNIVTNAAGFYRSLDVTVKGEVSLLTLLRQMNDPDVRRGIYFMLQFAKSMAAPPPPSATTTVTTYSKQGE